jgi:CRP/FNR family transcriptional regulator, cyclic AMP receptor protein
MPTKKRLPVDNRTPTGKTHSRAVDWEALLARIPGGKIVVQYKADSRIFRQGDPADSLFYLRGGKVKLSVTSEEGKEAIIAILDADEFFGEGCLAGQPLRMSTATAVEASALTRIARPHDGTHAPR